MTARYGVRDKVAIVILENPPVNGLGFATRADIVESLDQAGSDPDVVAIVLAGAGRAFSAGADIKEFNTPLAERPPTLGTVVDVIESSAKPVVAALHSIALGGGLEVALAAHYRVAARGTQVGLPEVKIGVLPGAGGTQRLPRAVGLELALNMIVSGATVNAEELAHTRLFDRVVEGDLLAEAVAFARNVAADEKGHPKIRDWKIEHANAAGYIELVRGAVLGASKEFPAPAKCVDAVEAAVNQPFKEGIRLEHEAFLALIQTDQSKALRHVFFAERAATKIADVGNDIRPRRLESVAVIGAGTMGSGITMNFLNAGMAVTLVEAQRKALDHGVETIRNTYARAAKKGKLSAQDLERRLALLRPTLSYEDIRGADLLIEAVFEDYAVKEAVFRNLDAQAKPGA